MRKKSPTGKIFAWLFFTYPITLNVAIELEIAKPFIIITIIVFIVLWQLMQAEYKANGFDIDSLNKKISGNDKYDMGNYRGAIRDYTKVIEISPNDAAAYNNRGISKVELRDYNGAIRDYTKAIEISPNDADAYINRGLAKLVLGDKIGACLDWSKAGELGDTEASDLIKKYCK